MSYKQQLQEVANRSKRPQDDTEGDNQPLPQDPKGRSTYANKHTTGPDAEGDKNQLPQDKEGYQAQGQRPSNRAGARKADRNTGATTPDRDDETMDVDYQTGVTAQGDYYRSQYGDAETSYTAPVTEAQMTDPLTEKKMYASKDNYVKDYKGEAMKDKNGGYMTHTESGYIKDSKGNYMKDSSGNYMKADSSYMKSSSKNYMKEDEPAELQQAKDQLEEEIHEQISADLGQLLESEDLSQEFQEKAATIFQTAVANSARNFKNKLEEKADEYFTQAVEEHCQQIDEQISEYLDYVVEQWMEENKLAIDNGIRANIAESFMGNLKSLLEGHYIDVPEEKADMVAEMTQREEQMREQLNESLQHAAQLNSQLHEAQKHLEVEKFVHGMVETQAAKIRELAEDVEFSDAQDFRQKLGTLKENYFPGKRKGRNLTESEGTERSRPQRSTVDRDITEDSTQLSESKGDPRVKEYAKKLSQMNRK